MSGGHYIAYTAFQHEGERHWFYFSDSHIKKVSESKVLQAEAYLLFYKRIFI